MRELDSEDTVSILEYFKDLPDPRSTINRRHLLGDLVVICVLAVIAGCDGPRSIAKWAEAHALWLKDMLELPGGIPSHDTVGRLLAALDPDAFQYCFQRWISTLTAVSDGATNHIAIDGKSLRRSHDHARGLGPLFLLSAWSVSQGISLGQLATEDKSNEITAIPELLAQINVKAAVVTIDAAGCQRDIAAQIVEAKGDYVLALKGNQKTTYTAVRQFIATAMEQDFKGTGARRYTETVKGHGREDTLTYYQMPVPEDLKGQDKWTGLKSIGVAIRTSVRNGKETFDVRYYLSSLETAVRKFAQYVRGHWAIENTLHWCLDMTFREDESRVRNRHAANNLAWLKRFTIGLLKQCKDKESIAMRRRMAGWNVDYLAQVLAMNIT
jgi:predicted transposase YbfD/YdcC